MGLWKKIQEAVLDFLGKIENTEELEREMREREKKQKITALDEKMAELLKRDRKTSR